MRLDWAGGHLLFPFSLLIFPVRPTTGMCYCRGKKELKHLLRGECVYL